MELYGGIEAGGTKFVCSVASGPDEILDEVRFPTTTPEETIQKSIRYFKEFQKKSKRQLSAIGIGSFGPIDLNKMSLTYGFITTTPKSGWQYTDLIKPISNTLNIPVVFDTDVNAAAIGEGKWGAATGLKNYIYLTIGTGIGGGLIINGNPVHGLVHPEMGHILLSKEINDDFQGVCPFHPNCFEALASGTAMKSRWNIPAEDIPKTHPAWELEAGYIAQALHNYICSVSPEMIILGGGVMQQTHLISLVRKKVKIYLNDYIQSPVIIKNIDQYIVLPGLGNQAGVLGAIALAMTER